MDRSLSELLAHRADLQEALGHHLDAEERATSIDRRRRLAAQIQRLNREARATDLAVAKATAVHQLEALVNA